MGGKLANQVAWISGGASGMGEATAELFADEGAAVAIVDIQREFGERLAKRINDRGGRATFVETDVRSERQVARSFDAAAAAFGSPSIAVNCAGIVHVKQLHEYSEAEWDDLMGVNVKSIFFSIKHGLPHFTKHARSYMVNIGSIGSFIGQANTPAYTTSKGAVLQLSRSIALDYAALGLRCNCVCPGITDTPMLRYHMSTAPDPEAALSERLRRVPMGTALSPHDIAKAVLYLSCEDSSGVTGASLVIDGGYLAAAEWQCPPHTAFMDGG
jgi:NAD(P)-dependent dehydrogenase (short-subunit alcohol dehydrogenase family)